MLKAHSDVMSGKSRGGNLPAATPGFTFHSGDFEVTGYLEQDDQIHVYYLELQFFSEKLQLQVPAEKSSV